MESEVIPQPFSTSELILNKWLTSGSGRFIPNGKSRIRPIYSCIVFNIKNWPLTSKDTAHLYLIKQILFKATRELITSMSLPPLIYICLYEVLVIWRESRQLKLLIYIYSRFPHPKYIQRPWGFMSGWEGIGRETRNAYNNLFRNTRALRTIIPLNHSPQYGADILRIALWYWFGVVIWILHSPLSG